MRVTHMEGDAHVYTGEVTYDEHSNLASFEEQVGTARTPYTTTFAYDEENRPTLLKYGSDTDKVAYTYDGLGRIEKRTLTVGGTARETSYAYIAGGHGEGSTTGLVASISQTGGNFSYTYDDNGNITSVVQDGVTTSYTYDALGQLIRVVDGHEGATWEYEYDQGGNILSKKKYVDGTLVESKTFTYGNSNWKDQLTAVNGTTITYDQIGNPLNDGTWTYTWEKGRQLKSMSKSGTTASFKYNENGLRIQKTVNGVVTNYTLHGKNIVHMTQGSNSLHFYYDASNKPAIVEFNGTKYAYVNNLQGDIVAILDSNGNKVVEYKYDAWGKPISKTGNMKDGLGTLNPFRYRGYVYDEETGLYYLRSRYLHEVTSRFINCDTYLSKNLYAYCNNSPTIQRDDNGFAGEDSIKEDAQELPDYTLIILRKLEYAEIIFECHPVSAMPADTVPMMTGAQVIQHVFVENLEEYLWFAKQVFLDGPWDLKNQWEGTFPHVSKPTSSNPVLFDGEAATAEDLGNFAYGYLGSSMGISRDMLYFAGGVAQKWFEDGVFNFSVNEIFNGIEYALFAPANYGESDKDFKWVKKGIDYYHNTH